MVKSVTPLALGATLLLGTSVAIGTGCSPLGWYDDPAPHRKTAQKPATKYRTIPKNTASKRTARVPDAPANVQDPPPAQDYDAPPRDAAPPNVTTPTAPPAVAEAPKPRMQIVQTGQKGMYYIIDRARKLCFFHNGGAVAQIDCAVLPEAADIATKKAPAPKAPVQPEQPAPERSAQPAPPARPAPPAPAQPKTFRGSDKGHAAGGDQTPTAEEATRFTQAYVAIFCDRQAGGKADPRTTIQSHGLSVERYSEIETYMARDERRWRSLTQAAIKGCQG